MSIRDWALFMSLLLALVFIINTALYVFGAIVPDKGMDLGHSDER